MKSLFFFAATKIPADQVHIPNGDANTILSNGLNIVYLVAGIICVITIVVAGLNYTLSGGSSDQITRAKNAIIYALAGLVVIFMAFIITGFVIGSF